MEHPRLEPAAADAGKSVDRGQVGPEPDAQCLPVVRRSLALPARRFWAELYRPDEVQFAARSCAARVQSALPLRRDAVFPAKMAAQPKQKWMAAEQVEPPAAVLWGAQLAHAQQAPQKLLAFPRALRLAVWSAPERGASPQRPVELPRPAEQPAWVERPLAWPRRDVLPVAPGARPLLLSFG